jgi:hypothetical protein
VGNDPYRVTIGSELTPGCKASLEAVERNLGLLFEGFGHPAFRLERLGDYAAHFIATIERDFVTGRQGGTPESETARYLASASRAAREKYAGKDGEMAKEDPLTAEEAFACARLADAVAAFSLVETKHDDLLESIREHARNRRADLRDAMIFRRAFWRVFEDDITAQNTAADKADRLVTAFAVTAGMVACGGSLIFQRNL